MRKFAWVALLSLISLGLGCGDDDNANQSNQNLNNQSQHDAGTGDHSFGDSCSCSGTWCEPNGVPWPNAGGGPILGCENVPTDWPDAELVCLRSYEGPFTASTYYSNGSSR